MHHILLTSILTISLLTSSTAMATDPMATDYSWQQCQGSALPYPVPRHASDYPDTLRPVMINHVGRHGARNPSSPKNVTNLLTLLKKAEAEKTITPAGRHLLKVTDMVMERCSGDWGALDSLGMAEQQGIAARMYATYPELFHKRRVTAISSYVPRCIMSMDQFTHQLARLDNTVEINAASGHRFSPLMRFFSDNPAYTEAIADPKMKQQLDDARKALPTAPLRRILGNMQLTDYQAIDAVTAQFATIAGLSAMEMGNLIDILDYFTPAEYNQLWSYANLHHYLQHSASTISAVPAEVAAPLLADLINTTDMFVNSAGSADQPSVQLRFGHAETLMPLLALLHLPGCYYLTNYFDTVGLHWRDFDIVPMAANLQLILFRSETGHYYLRTLLNEQPVTLIPGSSDTIIPWQQARLYLLRCLPL